MPKLPMKTILPAVFAICLGTLAALFAVMGTRRDRSIGVTDPHGIPTLKRQVHYGFTLQNQTDRLLESVNFWTYGPVKETSTQRCSQLDASHPYDLTVDDLGNQVLHFTFRNLPPFASKIVTVRAEVSVWDTPQRTAEGNPGDALKPGRFIESNDPALVKLAQSIRPHDPGAAPEAIFRWISENIRHGRYTKDDRGALHCLNRKEGDCTEQMHLFVALCRASGIPARGLGGYVCHGDCILNPNNYHNWAEFHRDGAWRLADPQKGVFLENPSRYLTMRIMGASSMEDSNPMGPFHRFRVEGDGIVVKMNP